MNESSIGLPLVGRGPSHHSTDATKAWRDKMAALGAGALVDVLLDDGRIVRTKLRWPVTDASQNRFTCWVEGIQGSYALGRVRPADGWWRTPGCRRVDLNPFSDLPWRYQEMATLGLRQLSWMLQPC